jgi:hypothetical protein
MSLDKSSEEFIPLREYCSYHQVEVSFVHHLHDAGLIEMTMREGSAFLPTDELPVLEKFIRWHYDLSINPAGIEALSHVLQRFENLLAENRTLRYRLRRFEGDAPATTIPPSDYSEL